MHVKPKNPSPLITTSLKSYSCDPLIVVTWVPGPRYCTAVGTTMPGMATVGSERVQGRGRGSLALLTPALLYDSPDGRQDVHLPLEIVDIYAPGDVGNVWHLYELGLCITGQSLHL